MEIELQSDPELTKKFIKEAYQDMGNPKHRCTGHCCRSFCTRYSPTEWHRIKMAFINKETEVEMDNGTLMEIELDDRDLLYIADMLVLVSGDPTMSSTREGEEGHELNINHNYSCKHFDGHNCTAYEERPAMCRDYPYGRKCSFQDCTLKH